MTASRRPPLAAGIMDLNPGLTLWTAITFLILLVVLRRFAWGPIISMLDERERTIRDAIDQAKKERDRGGADARRAEGGALRSPARGRRDRQAQNQQEVEAFRAQLTARARKEADELVAASRRQIQEEKSKAMAELRTEVADIAIAAAERLVKSAPRRQGAACPRRGLPRGAPGRDGPSPGGPSPRRRSGGTPAAGASFPLLHGAASRRAIMGLAIGIVGLPNVGKSTLFNALLGRGPGPAANYPFCTIDPNVGVVPVPDRAPREARRALQAEERNVPTTLEFVDIAGLVAGASQGRGARQSVPLQHPRGGRRRPRAPLLRGPGRGPRRRGRRPARATGTWSRPSSC